MKKYRKRPVEVEAVKFEGNFDEVEEFVGGNAEFRGGELVIATLEGAMHASPGDWIIRGVQGEFYPCKPGIFEATYEAADTVPWSERVLSDAYTERARILAWIAAWYPAVLAPATDITDEPGWKILFVEAGPEPGQQLSWHIAPADQVYFKHVKEVEADHPRAQWDKHTTVEKYDRISAHISALVSSLDFRYDTHRMKRASEL